MQMNQFIRTLVGADLSCPPPIFRYPDYLVNMHYRALAERVGFEPTRACTLPLFESGTFDHSDISPRRSIAYLSGYSKHNITCISCRPAFRPQPISHAPLPLNIEQKRTIQKRDLSLPYKLAHREPYTKRRKSHANLHIIFKNLSSNLRGNPPKIASIVNSTVSKINRAYYSLLAQTSEHPSRTRPNASYHSHETALGPAP